MQLVRLRAPLQVEIGIQTTGHLSFGPELVTAMDIMRGNLTKSASAAWLSWFSAFERVVASVKKLVVCPSRRYTTDGKCRTYQAKGCPQARR